MYKMNTFAIFTAEAWKKMMLKFQNMVVKYGQIKNTLKKT